MLSEDFETEFRKYKYLGLLINPDGYQQLESQTRDSHYSINSDIRQRLIQRSQEDEAERRKLLGFKDEEVVEVG